MSTDTNYVIALEFGGQSVKAARVDLAGNVVGPYRFELDERNPPSFNEFVKRVTSIIQKAKENHDITAVGVACPNPYISREIILQLEHKPAYEYANGKSLREHILEAAGCKNLFDTYDAGAAVKGELWKGDLPNQGRHMFLTLGTGLGSAFVFNGEIIKGQLGAPDSGEIWDLPYNGKNLEEWAGTMKVMVRIYRKLGGTDSEVLNGNIKHLADIADSNHPEYCLARDAFKEFGKSLGAALAYACSDFGPESFILAGNIAKAFDLFEEEVTSSYLCHASSSGGAESIFKQSELIDTNGLLGAACVAFVGMGISIC